MTRIALAFISLHFILPPVLFTSNIRFSSFKKGETVGFSHFKSVMNVYLTHRVGIFLGLLPI